MSTLSSLIIKFFIGLTILGTACAGGAAYVAWQYIKSAEAKLPPVEKLTNYEPIEPTLVLARDGTKIGEIFTERRYPIAFKEMNQTIVDSFLAAEDARFFEHSGVDYFGVGRAIVHYLRQSKNRQGGSTITQQLAKNVLLTRERTIERKLKDILLAQRIEKMIPKEKILELYLNTIFLGNNSYGIEAAARNYFRKPSRDLDLAESALIAGLAPAPSAYSPVESQQKAKARQRFVLDQLVKGGKISSTAANAAYAKPLKIFRAESPNAKAAPYFFAEVKKELEGLFSQEKLTSQGYRVYTTVDPTLQQHAQQSVENSLKAFELSRSFKGPLKRHGEQFEADLKELAERPLSDSDQVTAFVVDSYPEIGAFAIVSQSGLGLLLSDDHGWTIASSRAAGKSPEETFTQVLKIGDEVHVKQLDRKTPKKVSANLKKLQELGKYLKYFPQGIVKGELKYYELSDTEGIEAAALIADAKKGEVLAMVGGHDFSATQYNRATQAKRQVGSGVKPLYYSMAFDNGFSPASLIDSPPIVIGDWRPENYSKEFTGRATLRRSLVQSYNIQSIQLAQALGLQKCAQQFHKLGLDWSAQDGGLSLALGAGSATLLSMVQAYTPFANTGRISPLHYIQRVEDRKGNVVLSWDKNAEKLTPHPITASAARENKQKDEENRTPEESESSTKVKRFWEFNPQDHLQVLSPQAAFVAATTMQEVIRQGTGTAAQGVSPFAAGKTGTTNNYADAWFMGFVPGMVGGVWVGFDDSTKSMGAGSSGGKVAAPFWQAIMAKAVELYPPQPWVEPENIRWTSVDLNTGKPIQNGIKIPAVLGAEPTSPTARNALGVLGIDSNGTSEQGNEDHDTSALRNGF
jgi:penicillin-binding protein 1A